VLLATAVWLAVVATGISLTHSHDDEPGSATPHRHLILFGVECPAETPADGDGPGQWQAPVDPPGDPIEPSSGAFVALLCLPMVEAAVALPHIAANSPTTPSGMIPSPRATRSAILRA
jgi:hypothetical protein